MDERIHNLRFLHTTQNPKLVSLYSFLFLGQMFEEEWHPLSHHYKIEVKCEAPNT